MFLKFWVSLGNGGKTVSRLSVWFFFFLIVVILLFLQPDVFLFLFAKGEKKGTECILRHFLFKGWIELIGFSSFEGLLFLLLLYIRLSAYVTNMSVHLCVYLRPC